MSVQEMAVRTGAVLVVAVLAWWLVSRVGRRYIERVAAGDGVAAAERAQRVRTLWIVLRRVFALVLIVVVALTVAVIWEIPIAPFVAVGSVVGVAIGFGAQNLVKDVIAGFFILAEDQFAIGDVVRISTVAGKVQDIRFRVTVLRDLEGNVHYVPNGSIEVASNLTQESASVVIDVTIAYEADVDAALEVFRTTLESLAADPDWSGLMLDPPEVLGVESLGDSAVVLRGVLTVVADQRWRARREALRRTKLAFNAAGVEIPFPQVTVHIAPSDD
jgi:small conductance mechanosensitive channel